jgi:hypothetical protein
MVNKVSFYCYLFYKPFDRIARYDILWKDNYRYLLKHTQLNGEYANETQQIAVTVYEQLSEAITEVILRLRNLEVETRVYKKLTPIDHLDEAYQPLLFQLEEAVSRGVKSFSIFGHVCKYRPQTAASNFLKSMGYFILTTKAPHVYVLDDFVKKEQGSVTHK